LLRLGFHGGFWLLQWRGSFDFFFGDLFFSDLAAFSSYRLVEAFVNVVSDVVFVTLLVRE